MIPASSSFIIIAYYLWYNCSNHKISDSFTVERLVHNMKQYSGSSHIQLAYLKKKYIIFLILITITTLFYSGCSPKEKVNSLTVQEEFDLFLDQVFIAEVQRDSLTLNYSVANPKNYGISDAKVTLGHYSVPYVTRILAVSENYLAKLNQFDYERLTESQKLSYDILKSDLELEQEIGDFILYNECLGPTSGIQAQLPILLAEFNFYSKEDIATYIQLLPMVYNYFEEIIAFERQKSEVDLFMNDEVADSVINQCKAFIETKEENYLIGIFNDKVEDFGGLTNAEIADYEKANKEAVLGFIIPAYELLIDTLEELKGTGVNKGGLSYYKNGKDYYEYLIRVNTGSSKSIEELKDLLDNSVSTNLLKLGTIMTKDSDVYDKVMNLSFTYTDPGEIIEYLKSSIAKDFPESPDVNCSIKYVHSSLQDYLSPAMYLIPAIDNYKDNTIYINNNPDYDLSQIFPTIAHEGYPGHLYQSVYFRELEPAAIRNLLDFGGYVEGWATYVEYYSYQLAGFDKNVADFLEANMAANMALYCRLDIGIHYDGWTLSDTANYLSEFGIEDKGTIKLLYNTMIEEPALYPQYGIGYLEILELRDTAKEELGEDFKLKDFHEFILNIGPAPFSVIADRLDNWMEGYSDLANKE
ncbi:MAG: hypothetical protein K0R21_2035 [Anaerocolumna sp.]|nr:hypothetical protein [Anaerocolumna sp.]